MAPTRTAGAERAQRAGRPSGPKRQPGQAVAAPGVQALGGGRQDRHRRGEQLGVRESPWRVPQPKEGAARETDER